MEEGLQIQVESCMQEINAVQEYEDVDLHKTLHKKGYVSQIVTDEKVMNVIGKFKRV